MCLKLNVTVESILNEGDDKNASSYEECRDIEEVSRSELKEGRELFGQRRSKTNCLRQHLFDKVVKKSSHKVKARFIQLLQFS